MFDAPSGQPAIREFSEGPELEAARCGLGCMGVILAVELPTVSKFKVAETVRIWQSLEEIFGLYPDQPLTQFFWSASTNLSIATPCISDGSVGQVRLVLEDALPPARLLAIQRQAARVRMVVECRPKPTPLQAKAGSRPYIFFSEQLLVLASHVPPCFWQSASVFAFDSHRRTRDP